MLRDALLALLLTLPAAAQTTQSAAPGGFASWGPAEWVLIIGAISGAAVSIVAAWKSNAKADNAVATAGSAERTAVRAQTDAVEAKSTAAAAEATANVNTVRVSNQAAGLHRVLHNAPPPTSTPPEKQ